MEAMLGMAIPQWYAEHYQGDRANYTIIMFPYLFCMLINISWAVCSWTYAAKIFPITMRAKDNALMTALLWTACYAVAQATPRPQHLYRPCHQNGSIESQYRSQPRVEDNYIELYQSSSFSWWSKLACLIGSRPLEPSLECFRSRNPVTVGAEGERLDSIGDVGASSGNCRADDKAVLILGSGAGEPVGCPVSFCGMERYSSKLWVDRNYCR
jgi:hypothetical protein